MVLGADRSLMTGEEGFLIARTKIGADPGRPQRCGAAFEVARAQLDLGLADFALAITLGLITSPGPFQLIVPNGPSMGLDGYPNVLTPAFVVPSSILLHALSLRQLRRRSRTEVLGRQTRAS